MKTAGRAIRLDRALHLGKPLRAPVVNHLLGAGFGGDYLGARDQLIAEGMIAIRMGIDERADPPRRLRLRRAHLRQHLASKLEIEKRIDQQ